MVELFIGICIECIDFFQVIYIYINIFYLQGEKRFLQKGDIKKFYTIYTFLNKSLTINNFLCIDF